MTTIDTFSEGRQVRRLKDDTPAATRDSLPPKGAAERTARAKTALRGLSGGGWLPYLLPVTLILLWQLGSSTGFISDLSLIHI